MVRTEVNLDKQYLLPRLVEVQTGRQHLHRLLFPLLRWLDLVSFLLLLQLRKLQLLLPFSNNNINSLWLPLLRPSLLLRQTTPLRQK